MQKLFICSHFCWAPTCRTTAAVAFSSSVPFGQHFRLFCSKVPANADTSETKKRQINETNDEVSKASADFDPFGWEPSKMQRFFLVLTRCYPNSAAIPANIPRRIGKIYGDRMRILRFASALMIGIFICFGLELYAASWDRRRRTGQLNDDEFKFVEKMRKSAEAK